MKNFINNIDINKLIEQEFNFEPAESSSLTYTIANVKKVNDELFLSVVCTHNPSISDNLDKQTIANIKRVDPRKLQKYILEKVCGDNQFYTEDSIRYAAIKVKNPFLRFNTDDLVILDSGDLNFTSTELFRQDLKPEENPFMTIAYSEQFDYPYEEHYIPVANVEDVHFPVGIKALIEIFANTMSPEAKKEYLIAFDKWCTQTLQEQTDMILSRLSNNDKKVVGGILAKHRKNNEIKNYHSKFAPNSQGIKSRKPIEDDFEFTM